jgi:hypothetical protein
MFMTRGGVPFGTIIHRHFKREWCVKRWFVLEMDGKNGNLGGLSTLGIQGLMLRGLPALAGRLKL